MSLLDTWSTARPLTSRRARRQAWLDDQAEADALIWAWRQACEGAGLSTVVDAAAGPTIVAPALVEITLGPPTVLLVRLLPGQLPGDVRRVGHRLAPHLGALAVRVEPRGHVWVRIELLDVDPLAGVLPLHLPRSGRSVLLGCDESGAELAEDWHRTAHTVVQGVTRSGKSVWTYGALAQLAPQLDVIVGGCDPTGLLWRPFPPGCRHAAWQVSGLADLAAHEALLLRLVEEMDHRIATLPADRDVLDVNEATPLLVVVLEELAGLLRALDAAKTKTDDPGKRVRSLIGRLLAEGAKVGVRVIILVQRAEAAVIGAFERAMCSLRISFRVDNRASVELLHPGADPELADQHATAAPGIALVTIPGRPLTRIRAPYLGGYPEYAAAIATACRPIPGL